eukprot:scaffold738_cov124-Cylindrotheca_fusiformis.AAC.12
MGGKVALLFEAGSETERTALRGKISPEASNRRCSSRRSFLSWRKASYFWAFCAVALLHRALVEKRQPPVAEVLHDSSVCRHGPCFSPAGNQVEAKSGFPSFLEYASSGPINVSYDARSIMLNGNRVLLLGGSLHPSRATKGTWEHALDEVVRNGLNLVTLYVMWEDHQPVPTKEIDWSFKKGLQFDGSSNPNATEWSLASAIRSAARRGLFVHLRIGPYDCAEYTYGGIPEYIPLQHPKIEMRRPNLEWLQVMQSYVERIVDYVNENELWAYQGGPIILGQIENELGGEIDSATENLLFVNTRGEFVVDDSDVDPSIRGLRRATLQDYANWCGQLVNELAPNVTWTMCNGFSAENTILTCNAISEATSFLEKHGDNGRVQIDQPPMFTEFEGGFQIWGEEADKPSDYFWGRTAKDMAHDALRWFSRGGTHLNYYMFWGSYSRGRQAAAGITNMYANDVMLCSSGQRHQPKFGHLQKLHQVVVDIAPTLLACETALDNDQPIEILNKSGEWQIGEDQSMFQYLPSERHLPDVAFVENNGGEQVVARIAVSRDSNKSKTLTMAPWSSKVVINGKVVFDSASIDRRFMAFHRVFSKGPNVPILLGWTEWLEPIGASPDNPKTKLTGFPVEQTKLNVESQVYSDYAWYETSFDLNGTVDNSTLLVSTQRANGIVVYIDDRFIGAADDHLHKEGPIVLKIPTGHITDGEHRLRILSESLGYNNLIGRWGGSTGQKTKGITGDVTMAINGKNISLVDGREWRSFPGLRGESLSSQGANRANLKNSSLNTAASTFPKWRSALFHTPAYESSFQGLFLKLNSGRGHLYLNGRDLGRHWNITKGETMNFTQEYYFLPKDFLFAHGRMNELVLFSPFPNDNIEAELLLSWIEASKQVTIEDRVDYPLACL